MVLLVQPEYITIKTEYTIPLPKPQPIGERFPETLFVDAFPVVPNQETLPEIFDLRAFAKFQNQFGTLEYGARPYNYKYKFKNVGPIYGTYRIGDAELNPNRMVEKWADLRIEVHKGCRRCFDTNCDGLIDAEDLMYLLATRGRWPSQLWRHHIFRAYPFVFEIGGVGG